MSTVASRPTNATTGASRRAILAGIPVAAAVGVTIGAASPSTRAVAAPASAAQAARDVVSVAYVEVNNHPLNEVGRYVLSGTDAPVFDLAIIFAANINFDGSSAYLHFNENVQATLDAAEEQIRPLQAKGIKVLLSILPNHQGAGFANFPDQAAAEAFAQELADTVEQYGLDGIDFDDEYANYGTNGTEPVNDFSFVYLVTALRQKLGEDKVISLYYIGESSTRTEYDGQQAGQLINYAWNPYYGTWGVPSVPGLDNSQLSPAAVWYGNTSVAQTRQFAERTVNEGYGVFLTYDLSADDASSQISAFTEPLYGSSATRS